MLCRIDTLCSWHENMPKVSERDLCWTGNDCLQVRKWKTQALLLSCQAWQEHRSFPQCWLLIQLSVRVKLCWTGCKDSSSVKGKLALYKLQKEHIIPVWQEFGLCIMLPYTGMCCPFYQSLYHSCGMNKFPVFIFTDWQFVQPGCLLECVSLISLMLMKWCWCLGRGMRV